MSHGNTELRKITRGIHFARSGEGRRVRVSAGVSQAAVAKAVGVSPAAVAHWETRHRTPQGDRAARYCDVITLLSRELEAR